LVALAAFWPHQDAQHCCLLRISEYRLGQVSSYGGNVIIALVTGRCNSDVVAGGCDRAGWGARVRGCTAGAAGGRPGRCRLCRGSRASARRRCCWRRPRRYSRGPRASRNRWRTPGRRLITDLHAPRTWARCTRWTWGGAGQTMRGDCGRPVIFLVGRWRTQFGGAADPSVAPVAGKKKGAILR
jgi:hypothetical protein